MKNRIVIDLQVFSAMLRELKGIRRELKNMKGEPVKKAVAKRELNDAIYTRDVLRMLKITPATLNSYEKKRLLQYHKEGRNKVYSLADVKAFKKSKGRSKRLSGKMLTQMAGGSQ